MSTALNNTPLCLMRKYFFLENYITSEGAVSHHVFHYQQLSIKQVIVAIVNIKGTELIFANKTLSIFFQIDVMQNV